VGGYVPGVLALPLSRGCRQDGWWRKNCLPDVHLVFSEDDETTMTAEAGLQYPRDKAGNRFQAGAAGRKRRMP